MGQQQLLIIILVTVIVGLATVIAINVLLTGRQEANSDAIRQKMMDASTIAQAYYYKNSSMGGGGGTYQNITLDHLNIEASDSELGEFSLEPGDKSFTLTAVPVSGGENIVGVIYSDRIEFISAEESE